MRGHKTFLQILVYFCCWSLGVSSSLNEGANVEQTGGDDAFSVIWNSPISECVRSGVDLNLSRYRIRVNEGGGLFGSAISLFYTLGQWPSISRNGTDINGGIPQLCNLTAHYQKTVHDINNLMPARNYTGVAVIDFESWRPSWDEDFDALKMYRDRSIQLVKRRYPHWNSTQLASRAKTEFESAARTMFEGTLTLVKLLRPHAAWTYYGFPKCFNYGHGQKHCAAGIREENDKLQWLYQSSAALSPSIYLNGADHNSSDHDMFVYGHVEESLRVSSNRWDSAIPIYPYSSYHYELAYTRYLNVSDLVASMGLSADMGAAGVVLWGSQHSVDTRDKCVALAHYVTTTLGPYVAALVDDKTNCSRRLCSARGRCVARGLYPHTGSRGRYQRIQQWRRQTSSRARRREPSYTVYMCVCYPDWTGYNCSTPAGA